MKPFVLTAVSGCLYIFAMVPAIAQVIPTADGVGTQVIQTGDLVEITGGQLSGDHANLFHSFEAFGLGADQIADFQVLPTVENVLGRVVGGAGSFVDGTLRVSGGDANLYLIDPAGIVFGENARLDVAGDFVATTATSIGFGDRWLEAIGSNDWASFVGNPSGFGFGGAGAIVNLGELAVEPGRSIGLLGDTVINTGSLSAAGGTVAIVANEAGDRLRLGIPGNVLSLEVDREAIHEDATALVLPELLAGAVESAGSIVRNPDGSVRLSSSPVSVTPQVGDALVSGSIDVSSAAGVGGSALVLGERVGLLAGAIDGSGRDGGGVVNVGGNFQGVGVLPNSELTMVDGGSSIVVDGVVLGDGGRAIVWADGATRFGGEVLARGGAEGGDGGFVEVSGKRFLDFVGFVDTSAVNGEFGTLLLDPENILIQETIFGVETSDLTTVNEFADPDIGGDGETIISSEALNNATSNIELQASDDIQIVGDINIRSPGVSLTLRANDSIFILSDFSLSSVETNQGNLSFIADANSDGYGGILISRMNIQTNGGNFYAQASRPVMDRDDIDLIDGKTFSSLMISALEINSGSISTGEGNIELRATHANAGRDRGFQLNSISVFAAGLETQGSGSIILDVNGTYPSISSTLEPMKERGILLRMVNIETEDGDISFRSFNAGRSLFNGLDLSQSRSLRSLGAGSINIESDQDIYIGINSAEFSTHDGDISLSSQGYTNIAWITFRSTGVGNIRIGNATSGRQSFQNSVFETQDGNIIFQAGQNGGSSFGDILFSSNTLIQSLGTGEISFIQNPVIRPAAITARLGLTGSLDVSTQGSNINVNLPGYFRVNSNNTRLRTNGGDLIVTVGKEFSLRDGYNNNFSSMTGTEDLSQISVIDTDGGDIIANTPLFTVLGTLDTRNNLVGSGDILINASSGASIGAEVNAARESFLFPGQLLTSSTLNAGGSISLMQ